MTQNRSHAVMAQRAEPHDSLDFFPTPLWATRALCSIILEDHDLSQRSAWDPACGQGHMARPLSEYFGAVHASDVHDYGYGEPHDFIGMAPAPFEADLVITNPPFRLAKEFIQRGIDVSRFGVCVLVRTAFLEGVDRYQTLYKDNPPAVVALFSERVPMVKGRVDPKVSTATSYAWLIWKKRKVKVPQVVWIPPCRKELERDGDYD